MNRNIMSYVESMELIIEKMGRKYTWVNVEGKNMPFDDYVDKRIDSNQVIKDLDALLEILKDAYLNSKKDNLSIDDFVTIFAIFCNLYIKAGFHLRGNTKKSINKIAYRLKNIIDDKILLEYLELIYTGIIFNNIECFVKALEIFPQYQLPYLYLFVKTAKKAIYSYDKKLDKMMEYYYSKLNCEMQQYAIGEGEYIRESSNLANDENLLPYILFENLRDKVVRALILCFDSCEKKIIKDVKFKKNDFTDGRYLLCSFVIKYLESISKIVNEELKYEEFIFDLGTVFEKMKILSSMDKDKSERGCEDEEEISELYLEEIQGLRLIGLGLPVEIEASREVFMGRLEIVKLNNSLEKAIADKNALINKHAHNWKHIIYPETVKNVADKLYVRGDFEYANKLFHAYNSQILLQQDLNLLQLQYTSTPEEYQKAFKKTIYLVEDKRGVGIVNVFKNALETVLFRLIMEEVDTRYSISSLKNNMFSSVNREVLRDSYVESFVVQSNAKVSVIDWFSKNIYPITISLDDCWNDVKFKPNDIAFAQITEVFIDLLHNALNYGVKSKDGYIQILFKKEVIGDESIYLCTIKNPCEKDSSFSEGSGQGLRSIYEVMENLNTISEDFNSNHLVEHCIQNNVFSITFRIQEKMLVKRRIKK